MMVNSTIYPFSIYGHINQGQFKRRRDHFVEGHSPSVSPELQERSRLARQVSRPTVSNTNCTEIYSGKSTNEAPISRSVHNSRPLATATTTLKLAPNKATIETIRRVRRAPPKSKPTPSSRLSSPSEAEQARPAEEVDPGSETVGVVHAVPHKEASQPDRNHQNSKTNRSVTPAPKEVYGYEHRAFFLSTKRSLRGRTTTDIIYPAAKTHIVKPDEYYDLCDISNLFSADSEGNNDFSLTRNSDKKFNELADAELSTQPPRPHTRSFASASNGSCTAMLDVESRSDVDMQQLFVQWVDHLAKKHDELNKQIAAYDERIDDLREIISIRDEDVKKLQTKLQASIKDARRKVQNDAEVALLKRHVADLKTEVATANHLLHEHKERLEVQNTQLTTIYRSNVNERNEYEKKIEGLESRINILKSQPSNNCDNHFLVSPPLTQPYMSPLSRAIGREMSALPPSNTLVLPTQRDSSYLTLEIAAKAMVRQGAGLLKGFGDVSVALIELRDVIEKQETRLES